MGKEVTLSTDYNVPGDASTIAVSYKKLAHDLKPGMQILMADGSISLQARTIGCTLVDRREFPFLMGGHHRECFFLAFFPCSSR